MAVRIREPGCQGKPCHLGLRVIKPIHQFLNAEMLVAQSRERPPQFQSSSRSWTPNDPATYRQSAAEVGHPHLVDRDRGRAVIWRVAFMESPGRGEAHRWRRRDLIELLY